MVPSAFVFLESLPLTRNKKLDRAALPLPEGAAFAHAVYVAPRTDTEHLLVMLWQENLALEQVGIEDNYFSIGGDSIRSIALVARARAKNIHFSIKDLFSNPTIKALAAEVEAGGFETEELEQLDSFSLLSDDEKEFLFDRLNDGGE